MRIFCIARFSDIHSEKWVRYFEEQGHDIYRYNVEGFSLLHVPRIRKAIRKFRPDILHAHYMGVNGLLGVLSGFHPFVGTVHGSEVLLTRCAKRNIVRWVLKKADMITTDGLNVEKEMLEMGINWNKIHLIRFGVDVDRFRPMPEVEKRVDVLFRCGNDRELYDWETFDRAVEPLGCATEYLRDNNPFDMPKILNGSLVYVSTALSDAGIASTTAEAMACGLPVVISDVGENRTWVNGDYNDWVFKPKDHMGLRNKLMKLLGSPKLRDDLGRKNRDVVCKNDDYNTEMSKMEKLYRRLVNGKAC